MGRQSGRPGSRLMHNVPSRRSGAVLVVGAIAQACHQTHRVAFSANSSSRSIMPIALRGLTLKAA